MSRTRNGELDRAGPFFVAATFLAIIFGLYGKAFLPFGFVGVLAGALVGVGWALLLGFIADRLLRRETWRSWLASTPLFLAINAIGLTIGGGYMYASMMQEALDEPSMTYAVLSALMQPAVPFYIVLNSSLELLLVPLTVFGNWHVEPRRRTLVLIGVAAYFAMRVWTYLVFAETRLEISQQPLSETDVAWFSQTLASDFRIVLNVVTFVTFLLAAFVPVRPVSKTAPEAAGRPSLVGQELVFQS